MIELPWGRPGRGKSPARRTPLCGSRKEESRNDMRLSFSWADIPLVTENGRESRCVLWRRRFLPEFRSRPRRRRSADFPTCCSAGFPTGRPSTRAGRCNCFRPRRFGNRRYGRLGSLCYSFSRRHSVAISEFGFYREARKTGGWRRNGGGMSQNETAPGWGGRRPRGVAPADGREGCATGRCAGKWLGSGRLQQRGRRAAFVETCQNLRGDVAENKFSCQKVVGNVPASVWTRQNLRGTVTENFLTRRRVRGNGADNLLTRRLVFGNVAETHLTRRIVLGNIAENFLTRPNLFRNAAAGHGVSQNGTRRRST